MTQTQPIRRRPDGSIDTAHYIAVGRQARSQTAHRGLSTGGRALARAAIAGSALVALLAVLPALF